MRATDEQAALVAAQPTGLAVALGWARQGWPVLPCHPDSKAPLVEGGKDSATTDPAQIRAWWREFPGAIVGGRTDGKVVLDYDSYKQGHEADLAELGPLPPTRTFRTPGQNGVRGRHLVFRDPDGLCRSTKLGPHGTIDVRAGTSRDYVILPGSLSSAGRYEVAEWWPVAVAPAWLRLAAAGHGRAPSGQPEGLPDHEDVPPGADLAALAATGTDDPSAHTFRLLRNCKRGGLTPGQARTLAEADEVTADRIGQPRHGQPRWWPDEFWRVWSQVPEPASVREPGCPVLPDEFWETRSHPFLAHIRQAALFKMRSPDSILHAVLANVALLTHYCRQLPDLGSPGTLDLLVGLVAGPGGGKGTSAHTADELVRLSDYEEQGDDDRRFRTRSLGSGEGMAASYFELMAEEGADGKEHMVTKRYAIGVRFVAPEGAAYAKLSERSGQTTGELIRSVFMGERIGGTFVGQSRGKQLAPRQYRAVLVLQLQPQTTRAILDEREVGTPQRLLWSCPVYANLPPLDELPPWPGPLAWQPSTIDLRLNPAEQHGTMPIRVHPEVMAEVRQFLWLRATGRESGAFDGHRALLRLKAAALLGCLRTARPVVGRSDWAAAGQVLDTSDAVRSWALATLGSADQERRQASIGLHADKAEAAELAVQSVRDRTLMVAQRIQRYCKQRDGARTRELRDNTKGRHGAERELFRPALARAQAEGWIEQREDKLWYAL